MSELKYQHELQSAASNTAIAARCARLAEGVGIALEGFRLLINESIRVATSPPKDEGATLVLILIDFFESMDGVRLLVERGSASNCDQLLRTSLELELYVMFLLDDMTQFPRRAYAYHYFAYREQLKYFEKLEPGNKRNSDLLAEIAGHDSEERFRTSGSPRLTDAIRHLQHLMNQPWYQEVRAELAANNNLKNWYSLWNGPRDARALAARMKMLTAYETYYRLWCGRTHGAVAVSRVISGSSTGTEMAPVRSPNGLTVNTLDAINMIRRLARYTASKYSPTCNRSLPFG